MDDFAGWMPIRVNWKQASLRVIWAYLGDLRLTDPFFEQTVSQSLRHPANLLFRHETPITELEVLNRKSPGLRPTGFIFHVSRCGSTLVSQMLAALPEHVVISEASPIDGILRSHLRDPGITEEQRILWLRWMLNALGQQRHPTEKHLFVKFDCWHALFLPLIQKAFPDVPWIFLYRDPVEVMVSHKNQMGSQMVPGALESALFGWNDEDVRRMRWVEYGGRVLGKICEAALAQTQAGKGRLVDYRQLPQALCPALMQYWKADCTLEAAEKMAGATRFHAKNPVLPFADDALAKQRGATEEIRQVVRQWLSGFYQQLEVQRLAQWGEPGPGK